MLEQMFCGLLLCFIFFSSTTYSGKFLKLFAIISLQIFCIITKTCQFNIQYIDFLSAVKIFSLDFFNISLKYFVQN